MSSFCFPSSTTVPPSCEGWKETETLESQVRGQEPFLTGICLHALWSLAFCDTMTMTSYPLKGKTSGKWNERRRLSLSLSSISTLQQTGKRG